MFWRTLPVLVALLAWAPFAHAAPPIFVNVGPLITASGGHDPSVFGAGGEASVVAFPGESPVSDPASFGFGPFTQVESYSSGPDHEPAHLRWAAGLQAGSWFGGELGYTYQSAAAGEVGTPGVHAALYLSMGYLSAAVRMTIAPSTIGGDPAHGWEVAFAMTLKLPLQVSGQGDTVSHVGHLVPCVLFCK
jgi:hypothetical protein